MIKAKKIAILNVNGADTYNRDIVKILDPFSALIV